MAENKEIPLEVVHKVALLARMSLSDTEAARMQKDLGAILGYVEKLKGLDTTGVPPTAHASDLAVVWREDKPAPSLSVEQSLRNAPERLGDGFGVPKIIE